MKRMEDGTSSSAKQSVHSPPKIPWRYTTKTSWPTVIPTCLCAVTNPLLLLPLSDLRRTNQQNTSREYIYILFVHRVPTHIVLILVDEDESLLDDSTNNDNGNNDKHDSKYTSFSDHHLDASSNHEEEDDDYGYY
jgi:hypothetical protein